MYSKVDSIAAFHADVIRAKQHKFELSAHKLDNEKRRRRSSGSQLRTDVARCRRVVGEARVRVVEGCGGCRRIDAASRHLCLRVQVGCCESRGETVAAPPLLLLASLAAAARQISTQQQLCSAHLPSGQNLAHVTVFRMFLLGFYRENKRRDWLQLRVES